MSLPLQGVRIVDMGHTYAVSHGTKFLADLGAEVIKIESVTYLSPSRFVPPYPDNDPGPQPWNTSANWHELNRNKLDLTLDLTADKGKELFKKLVAVSDVVMENFSAGVMARLGLDYAVLSKIKPDVVMYSSSGFGHSGPWMEYKAFGGHQEALTGVSSVTGYIGGVPAKSTIAFTDVPSGVFAALAVLVALRERARTGRGQSIDASQYEIGTSLIGQALLEYSLNGRVMGRIGNRDPEYAPQGCYRCAGADSWLTISVTTDAGWRSLAAAIGRADLADDPRFRTAADRRAAHDAIDAVLSSWTAGRDHLAAAEILQRAGIAAGPVLNGKELLLDPHLAARGFFQRFTHPPESGMRTRIYFGMPFVMSKTPLGIRKPGPDLGESNRYVLMDLLGLSEGELAALEREGVIGNRPKAEGPMRGREARGQSLEALTADGTFEGVDADYKEILGI